MMPQASSSKNIGSETTSSSRRPALKGREAGKAFGPFSSKHCVACAAVSPALPGGRDISSNLFQIGRTRLTFVIQIRAAPWIDVRHQIENPMMLKHAAAGIDSNSMPGFDRQ